MSLTLSREAVVFLPEWAWDLCWLDCPRPGRRITYLGKEICLCGKHRKVLDDGLWGNTYDGAPLPPDSRAGSWPWREIPVAS